jgi:hypothetical protein
LGGVGDSESCGLGGGDDDIEIPTWMARMFQLPIENKHTGAVSQIYLLEGTIYKDPRDSKVLSLNTLSCLLPKLWRFFFADGTRNVKLGL